MMTAVVGAILGRELRTLKRELEAYPDERDIWRTLPGLPNSAGNLALHLAGNLRHFVGAQLGATGYVRDRDAEFATRNLPRAALLAVIDRAIEEVESTLSDLNDQSLARQYPLVVANCSMLTGDFLVHLASHLAYHLGQVDYHRRAVTGDPGGVGAISPARLSTSTPVEGGARA